MDNQDKCWCGRFDVPWCCKKYLEDLEGYMVHTPLVCFDKRSGMPLFPPVDREKDFLDLHED